MTATPTRSTGAVWRPGDPVGDRRFVEVGEVRLERGGVLPAVTVAYETWGTLSPGGENAVLVEHALTGDSHVVGDAGSGHPTGGWWPGLVGPGAPLDTDRLFVVAANVLGGCQGSTGPASPAPDGRPWGSRFPFVTIRDQVAVEAALADALGIDRWALVLGGSMGGMRALEWAATHPDRVERALVLASTAAATADQVAWCQPQLLAIRHDPDFQGGDYYDTGRSPLTGLGIARRIAHTTYRHEGELDDRFGRRPRAGEDPLGGGGRYDVESYLDHHATKLARRFDPNSYVVLSEAMNSHDVGRDRGGVAAALQAYRGHLHVAGVTTDRLYPLRLSEEVVRARPGTALTVIGSTHGHDGFLVETGQVGGVIAEVLAAP
ncbi:homoserine O-acetyltransferase MetX [Phycicoccus avicenniae]|uniref:homoserine O-acetyltransferase MetX n=1 Tax=Phycicoccus avicenniae TaxID=2828860 RepID=UPI003D2CF050